MEDELQRLARLAGEYRDAGRSVVEVADLLVEKNPGLKETPFNLAQVLRLAFGLRVHDLHHVIGWMQGELSRETLEGYLRESRE